MRERTILYGPITVNNDAHLRKRAADLHDPRHVFYKAMLECGTYEEYTAATRGVVATTGRRKSDPTTGRQEILYARYNEWVSVKERQP